MSLKFTPKIFRQHLDYIKSLSSPVPQPKFTGNSDSNPSTPTPAASPMSLTSSPRAGLKRKSNLTHPDEPTSKRAQAYLKHDSIAAKQMLVPVVSRKETHAQLQLHHNYTDASMAAREDDSDIDFVDAEEDATAIAGAETPFVNMDGVNEHGLSVWRSNDMELPSSYMPGEAEDHMSLFPGLDGMYGFDGEDIEVQGAEYGQEGIDDVGLVKLDADGIPEMAGEVTQQHEGLIVDFQGPEQPTQYPAVYDLEDDENEPDLDAIIADANGTQAYGVPIEDESESEEAQVAEEQSQPQLLVHSQNSRGVQKLIAQDDHVDQFIVETGRTSEEEQHPSICDHPDLFPVIDDSPEPEESLQQQVKVQNQNLHPHGARGIFAPINYTPAPKNNSTNDDEIQILGSNDAALTQVFKAKGYTYQIPTNRPTTPPLLTAPSEGISPKSHPLPPTTTATGEIYNVSKTAAPTATLRAAELAHNNSNTGPTLPRDLPRLLRNYQAFHSRVLHLVPHLPNYQSFPWHRRYWIAVLYSTKNPKSAHKEKDFMWMKGNKHSTISTIWHNYALRTMEEDFVLTCRGELTAMEDVVEELDWFDSKLVVLRAVRRESRVFATLGLGGVGQEAAMWKDIGVVPRREVEVVTLDD